MELMSLLVLRAPCSLDSRARILDCGILEIRAKYARITFTKNGVDYEKKKKKGEEAKNIEIATIRYQNIECTFKKRKRIQEEGAKVHMSIVYGEEEEKVCA